MEECTIIAPSAKTGVTAVVQAFRKHCVLTKFKMKYILIYFNLLF